MNALASDRLRSVFDEEPSIKSTHLDSAYWDEPTVVSRDNPQLKLSADMDFMAQRPPIKTPPPKNKTEQYACEYPGCQRKFVNPAELRNHADVFSHHDARDDLDIPDSQQQFVAADLVGVDPNQAFITAYVASQRLAALDEETTVKPVPTPITAAALDALNSDSEPDLARSMHELSITASERHLPPASLISLDTTYSAVDDFDEIATSDVADADSPRISFPVRILLALWVRLFRDFSARRKSPYTQTAPYRDASDQHSSTSQYTESVGTPSHTSSVASSARVPKRKKTQEDDEDDGDGEDHNPRPSKRGPQDLKSSENRPFACPFNSYDSYTFGGDARKKDYHVCSTWHDSKTAYLKQHLLRNHCLPEHQCVRCGGDFKNSTNLWAHQRMEPPCGLRDIDSQKIMPAIQNELQLRTRNSVGSNRTTYWYKVYDTIFGKDARIIRPVEPFYKGPFHEVLDHFMYFCESSIRDVMRVTRERLNMQSEDYNEQNEELVLQILQEASQRFMAERKAARQRSLDEIRAHQSVNYPSEDPGERTVLVRDDKRVMELQPGKVEPGLAPSPWPQSGPDFSLQQNTPFQQHPLHSPHYMQGQPYTLPFHGAGPTMSHQPIDPGGYDQSAGPGDPYFNPASYDLDEQVFHDVLQGHTDYRSMLGDHTSYDTDAIDGGNFIDHSNPESSSARQQKLPED